MNRPVVATFAMLSIAAAFHSAAAQSPAASLRITQSALIVHCVNGVAVSPRTRSWTVTAPVVLAVTMRNEPRSGSAAAGGDDPGTATIGFTPEPGHRYEVEVRAEPMRFSTRIWPKGEWTPVVRDRTTDRVVSGPPDWVSAPSCPSAR